MATELALKSCVPCHGGMPTLRPDQVASLLDQLDGWRAVDGKKLLKSFKLKDFVEAVAFVNRIASVAEAEDHHPNLAVSYGKVEAQIWTHAVGGLTENDFILAAKIDAAH